MTTHTRKYRPEIDGLRAVAVALVVLFHAGLGVSGGFIGVDVFFVISGFLITSIILRDVSEDRFSFCKFWLRRVRRIIPAMAVMVASVLVVGHWLLAPADLIALGASSIAQLAFLANNFFAWKTDYFATASDQLPLLHTWSLAVEEQFYFVFPLLLFLTAKFAKRMLLPLFFSLAVASFWMSVVYIESSPKWTFFVLPTRAWELLIGAILAAIPNAKTRPSIDNILALVGIAAIGIPAFTYTNQTQFPGIAAVPPVLGSALFIYANRNGKLTTTGRLLATRPCVALGLISYSVYLWHWPIFAYSRYLGLEITSLQGTLITAISIVAGYLSWRFVEQPFRKQVDISTRNVVITAVATISILFCTSVWFWKSGGVPHRLPESLADAATWTGSEYATTKNIKTETGSLELTTIGVQNDGQGFDFLLWGDSHALVLVPLLDQLGKDYNLKGAVLAQHDMPPLANSIRSGKTGEEYKLQNNQQMLEMVSRGTFKRIFLVASWSGYVENAGLIPCTNHPMSSSSSIQSTDLIEEGLREVYKQTGDRLTLMFNVPTHKQSVAIDTAKNVLSGFQLLQVLPLKKENYLARQARVRPSISNAIPMDQVIDPAPSFLDETSRYFLSMNNTEIYYRDTHHLTKVGASRLRHLYEPYFRELAKNKASITGPPSSWSNN
ncbi:acyltransferase [Mariniblastus sp.]|nr:acyltransferase [Mariniblastus sp.]